MDIIQSVISSYFHAGTDIYQLLLVVMVFVWTVGRIFDYFQLPLILGEIVAGILIGPAFLNMIHIEDNVMNALADLGVFFIMFHTGIQTDIRELSTHWKLGLTSSFSALFFVSAILYTFSYFLGFSFSVSLVISFVLSAVSLPSLAYILKEHRLQNTPLGHTLLTSAITTEIVIFSAFSIFFATTASGQFDMLSISLVIIKVLLFFIGTIVIGKLILPFFRHFLNRSGGKAFTFSLIISLIFGIFAQSIGLPAILGAFFGGIFVQQEIESMAIFQKIEDRYFALSYSFLGPFYFASIGMKLIPSALYENIHIILIILFGLLVGQFLGTGIIIRFSQHFSLHDSLLSSSILLERGSTSIILSSLAFQHHLISESMFSILISLIISTTIIATILIKIIGDPEPRYTSVLK